MGGFDALVEAADAAAETLGIDGFAQIGGSRVRPRHLAWARFVPPLEMRARIAAARVVVCHGGIGLLGEAMRAGRPIVAMPRRGSPSAHHPGDDQLPLLRRLAERHPIRVCETPASHREAIEAALRGPESVAYALGSDIPELLARYLAASERGAATPSVRRPASRYT